MPTKPILLRAVPLFAAAAFVATPASKPVKLIPGRTANGGVYARRRGELSLRSAGARCAVRARVDRRAPVTVRAGGAGAEFPVASVARGWHQVSVAAIGCHSAIVIAWLIGRVTPPPVRSVAPPAAAVTPTPSIPPPDPPPPTPAPQPTPAPPSSPATPPPTSSGPPTLGPSAAAAPPALTGTTNPFAGQRFYLDANSSAAQSESSYLAQGDTGDAVLMAKIADNPQARWFGDWNGADPSAAVASTVAQANAVGALPVLVAYDIPNRDCGGQSAGGAATAADYETWIDGFARGIGNARAVVVLEPDALAEIGCMSAAGQQSTLGLLGYAVQQLSANPGTAVYLDAGNAGWQPASVSATRLEAAGVANAAGFSLNISNFDTTASEERYGDSVSALVGGKHFIVDTSRNGQGPSPDGQWCNPPGRGLGTPATTGTGDPLADALFWIKTPGESDGTCNGGPAAGTWWLAYALQLAQNAAF